MTILQSAIYTSMGTAPHMILVEKIPPKPEVIRRSDKNVELTWLPAASRRLAIHRES